MSRITVIGVLALCATALPLSMAAAQATGEGYAQGHDDGVAEASCELAQLLGRVLLPVAAAHPAIGEDEWNGIVAAMSAIAQACGLEWAAPERPADSESEQTLFGLKPLRPPDALPPDPQRRLRDATCPELERRYRRVEIGGASSHRDIVYRRAVGEELRARCW